MRQRTTLSAKYKTLCSHLLSKQRKWWIIRLKLDNIGINVLTERKKKSLLLIGFINDSRPIKTMKGLLHSLPLNEYSHNTVNLAMTIALSPNLVSYIGMLTEMELKWHTVTQIVLLTVCSYNWFWHKNVAKHPHFLINWIMFIYTFYTEWNKSMKYVYHFRGIFWKKIILELDILHATKAKNWAKTGFLRKQIAGTAFESGMCLWCTRMLTSVGTELINKHLALQRWLYLT